MHQGTMHLPDLTLRPAHHGDQPFLTTLYHSSRPDLQWLDGGRDLRMHVLEQQQAITERGMAEQFPNAIRHVIERHGTAIGALVTDFGANDIHIVYLAFIPQACGHGYGSTIIRGIQQVATGLHCPVSVVVWHTNPVAYQRYRALGFAIAEQTPAAARLHWQPPVPIS